MNTQKFYYPFQLDHASTCNKEYIRRRCTSGVR